MIHKQSSFNFCRSWNDGTTFADFGEGNWYFVTDHSQNMLSDSDHTNKTNRGSPKLLMKSRWKSKVKRVNAKEKGQTVATMAIQSRAMIRFRVESAIIGGERNLPQTKPGVPTVGHIGLKVPCFCLPCDKQDCC